MKPTGRSRMPSGGFLVPLLVVLICTAGCGRLDEGAPTEVVLTAASDTTVRVSWVAPGGHLPDSYVVAFMEIGSAVWLDVASAADSVEQTDHNPLGRTGRYRVTAVYGGRSYPAAQAPTSTPVHTIAMAVGELNNAVYSGYGWDRDSGVGSLSTMEYASNAARVDFYVTDWTAGFSGPDYYVASPDWGPCEPGGGLVPTGSWRPNWLTSVSGSELSLPPFDSTVYASSFKLAEDSTLVAVVGTDTVIFADTTDTFATVRRHYAIAKFGRPDTIAGTVQVETWFQRISDLRLIQH
ncbi:hypothetical protein JXD38_06905 [candidate division WOR-3 bacterium]|nr:hypothetical protein [candidate division WOR-3 bacterium]